MPPQPASWSSRFLLPAMVVIAGWAITGWIFVVLERERHRREEEFLTERIQEAQAAIRVRVNAYVDALLGGTSFFAASRSVDRGEWAVYAASLQLQKRYPGINGLGLIFAVPPDGVDAWVAARQADGEIAPTITPFPATVARPDDPKYLITYLEGNVGDRLPIGRNIASEPSRRWAAELARDTGEPQLHQRIPGSRDTQRRSGLLLYVPLYKKDAKPGTVEERRAAHIGWIYAQVFPDVFLDGVLGPMGGTLRLHFFENGELNREHLLYASSGQPGDPLPKFERITTMELTGQRFQLGWGRGWRFPPVDRSAGMWTATGLGLASLALGGLVMSLQNTGRRAHAIALARTAELAESEERFRSVAETAIDAIVVADAEGRVVSWNPGAERMFGRSLEEMAGTPLNRVLPVKYREAHDAARASLRTGERAAAPARPLELAGLRRDGAEFPIELALTSWTTASGIFFGALIRDVTDRTRAERELAEARDAALQASRLKSEFLASMSHEFRTPMNAIIGMTGLLADTPLTAEQRSMLGLVESAGSNLLSLVNDILDLSKIEAGKLRLEIAEFEPARLVEETFALLAPRAQEKRLAIRLENALAPELRLLGDSGRVRQVLTNLLGNAVKFTIEGSVVVAASVVRNTAAHVGVRFLVRDTGVGISADTQARLFQPFVQGEQTQASGTGLGLAISRQIVEAMGGTLDFQSELGRGSSFWFELDLPRAQPADAVVTSAPEGHAQDAGVANVSARRGPLRVLLAEDNVANRTVARMLLLKMGCEVEVVSHGAEAVERLAQRAFDVVLMDCQMPVLDGYDATRRIRSGETAGVDRQIPIVAVTAYAMPGDRAKCLAAGMNEYVTKPIVPLELRSALARCGLVLPGLPPPAAPVAARTDPVLDPRTVARLRDMPGESSSSLFDEMTEVFLAANPAELAGLESLARGGEMARLAEQAHALAGNAAALGGFALRDAALALERAARAADTTVLPDCFSVLRMEAARMRDALGETLTTGKQ